MDFIFDPSLVLYLPLHQLDGASFMSKDKHGHLCSVTGALWTPRGRSFDGVDDVLTIPSATSLQPANLTVELWIYPTKTLTAWEALCVKYPEPANNNYGYQMFKAVTDKIRFGVGSGSAFYESFSDAAIPINAWHHLIGTYNGTEVALYVDMVKQADTHAFTGAISHTGTLRIGAEITASPVQEYQGTIGEIRIYQRALTPSEAQRNYLATKWRFR